MGFDETVAMMMSTDYKERFKAEYYQTKIRYERLRAFTARIEAAERTAGLRKEVEAPKHDCTLYVLVDQQRVMDEYLHILEVRAVIEGIEL